jgi:hypothetical protein
MLNISQAEIIKITNEHNIGGRIAVRQDICTLGLNY